VLIPGGRQRENAGLRNPPRLHHRRHTCFARSLLSRVPPAATRAESHPLRSRSDMREVFVRTLHAAWGAEVRSAVRGLRWEALV
jgi:hypothetical protein